MISSKLTLQALMRNNLTGQADEHGLTRIKNDLTFVLSCFRDEKKVLPLNVVDPS